MINSRQIKDTLIKNYPQLAEHLSVQTITVLGLERYHAVLANDMLFSDNLRRASARIKHPQITSDENAPQGLQALATAPSSIMMTGDQWEAVFRYLEFPIPVPDISIAPPATEALQKWTCNDCNTEFKADITRHIVKDDEEVCDSCFEDYSKCDNCNGFFDGDNEGLITNDDYKYCEDCKDDNSFYCEDCEENYSDNTDNSSVDGGDRIVCSGCADSYFSCESCEERYHQDSSSYCEGCERDFCESCYSEHNCRNTCVFREIAEPQFFTGEPTDTIPFKRHVGFEIEAENGTLKDLSTDLEKTIAIALDGSLNKSGIEINTPPSSGSELERIVNHACEVLKKHGYKGTISCGLHIHIDARDIQHDQKKIVQIIKTFYSIEDLIYSTLPPSRWGNRYCQRLAKDYLYKNFKNKKDETKLEKEWYKEKITDNLGKHKATKYDSTRYYGVNIHSIFYRGTLELRYHSGTVNPIKILNWGRLALTILEYAISDNYNEADITALFDMQTSQDKFHKFYDVFKIPYNISSYLDARKSRFNPSCKIKFNEGKEKRIIENKDLNKRKQEKNLILARATKKARRDIDRGFIDNYTHEASAWVKRELKKYKRTNSYKQKVDELALTIARGNIQFLMLEKLPSEGGFIKEDNLKEYIRLIEQGINMANDSREDGEL